MHFYGIWLLSFEGVLVIYAICQYVLAMLNTDALGKDEIAAAAGTSLLPHASARVFCPSLTF